MENDIFIGLKPGYGDYVIAFRTKKGIYFEPSQNMCEFKYFGGSLRFNRHIRVIYAGENKF